MIGFRRQLVGAGGRRCMLLGIFLSCFGAAEGVPEQLGALGPAKESGPLCLAQGRREACRVFELLAAHALQGSSLRGC